MTHLHKLLAEHGPLTIQGGGKQPAKQVLIRHDVYGRALNKRNQTVRDVAVVYEQHAIRDHVGDSWRVMPANNPKYAYVTAGGRA